MRRRLPMSDVGGGQTKWGLQPYGWRCPRAEGPRRVGGWGGKGVSATPITVLPCLGRLRLAAPVGAVRVVGGERGSGGDGVNSHAPPPPRGPLVGRHPSAAAAPSQPGRPRRFVWDRHTAGSPFAVVAGGPTGGVRDGRVFTLAADSLYCPSFCFRIAISYSLYPHPPGRHSITTPQTASMPSVPPPHCRYGPHRSGSVGDGGGGRGGEGQGEGKRLAGRRRGEQLSRPGTVAAGEPRTRNGRCRDPWRGPLEGASLRNGNEPLTADRSSQDEILAWAPKIHKFHPGWRGGGPTRLGTRSLRTHHPR